MAEIPYKPVPSVQPAETGLPHITEQVPHVEISNAVGKALEIVGHGTGVLGEAYREVGDAYGKLGKGFESAGDELFTRAVALQQVELNKNVDKAELALVQQNGDLMENAIANPNLGPEGMRSAVKQSMDNRAAARQSLKTPWEREQFDKRTMNIITSDARRLASRVATTERSDALATSEAMIKTLKEKLADPKLDPESPDARELQQRLRDQTTNTWAPTAGVSPGPRLEQRLQDDQNDIKYNQILQTADGSLKRAMEMFNRATEPKNEREYISDAQKRQSLYNQLANKAKDLIPLTAANTATQDPNVSQSEAETRAGNDATKQAKDLGFGGDFQIGVLNDARTRARTVINDRESGIDFDDGKHQNDIARFIVENKINRKDLLPKEMQMQMEQMGAKNYSMVQSLNKLLMAPPEDAPKTDENRAIYHSYRGALMGNAGNEARLWAMNKVNFLAMEGMPHEWRETLSNMQAEQQKRGREAGENVNVRNLFELGKHERLIPTDLWNEKKEGYKQWVGAADEALKDATERKQRPLNKDEERELIKQITEKQVGLKGKALYEFMPTKDEVNQIKRLMPNATDEEATAYFRKIMMRDRLRILEDLKKGAKPTPSTPATPAPAGPQIKILKTKPVQP